MSDIDMDACAPPTVTTSPDDRPNAVELRDRDIVFGRRVKTALALSDRGLGREELRQRCGALMGLSGSGKMDLPLRAAIDPRLRSPHPTLFVDQLGRLAGLCNQAEIYRGRLQNL